MSSRGRNSGGVAVLSEVPDDAAFMREALKAAHLAGAFGEVPVGAAVVLEGEVIAVGRNQQIANNDPSAHAEIQALRAAAAVMDNYRLPECELYVTLEPCIMCFGAIVQARIKRVVFATREPRFGAVVSLAELSEADNRFFNHKVNYTEGVLQQASASLLKAFFKARR